MVNLSGILLDKTRMVIIILGFLMLGVIFFVDARVSVRKHSSIYAALLVCSLFIILPIYSYCLEGNTKNYKNVECQEVSCEDQGYVISYEKERVERIEIFPFADGLDITDLQTLKGKWTLLKNEVIDNKKVYTYHCRDEFGEVQPNHIDFQKETTAVLTTLSENEQPYIEKIHRYMVTVDNSVLPERVISEEYISTQNIVFLPNNSRIQK